jgi:hypothetical protein
MDQTSGARSFNGTIFHVWKGNRPCRIYLTGGQVYFIRRVVGINQGAAAVLGSQFGLLGGLAVGLAGAAQAKTSADFVRDDDPTPPDLLVSKHADNYAIPVADIIDPRIEPAGKYTSYGKNAGRWHFTRRGDAKETVVVLESPADVSQAVSLLADVLGGPPRGKGGTDGGRSDSASAADLVTDLPLPSEQADVVTAIQNLTQLLGEQASGAWQKVHCEVRAASPGSPRALEIIFADGDQPGEWRPTEDPAIYQAAMRLARKLSPSVKTFPGVIIEMTRLDQGRWKNHVKLGDKR